VLQIEKKTIWGKKSHAFFRSIIIKTSKESRPPFIVPRGGKHTRRKETVCERMEKGQRGGEGAGVFLGRGSRSKIKGTTITNTHPERDADLGVGVDKKRNFSSKETRLSPLILKSRSPEGALQRGRCGIQKNDSK